MDNDNDWLDFFNKENIPEKNQDNWQFSGLTIEEYDEFLPRGVKKEDLLKAIKNRRNTFQYKINEPNNEYNNDDNFLQRKGDKNLVEKNLDGWLKEEDPLPNQDKLKGYIAEIKKSKFTGNINKITISGAEVIEKEAELDKSLADIIVKLKKDEELKLKIVDVDGPGILPILTDSSKTTKVVRCLLTCIFPGKHIILITPNEELAADAENHHNTWLQYSNGIPYKCVIHRNQEELSYIIKNGELASWNKLIEYDNDDKGKPNKKKPKYEKKSSANLGKSTLSILQLHYLVRYIACKKVNIDELKDPKKNYDNFNKALKEIKEKLIDKENTIIIFDKAHFPNTMLHFLKKTFLYQHQNQEKTTANEYLRKINGEEDTDAEPILKSGLTTKKFKLLEESDIPFVIFDNTNSSAVSGITKGMPSGSLFIANINHKMGFSPDVDNVILTRKTQLEKLDKGPGAERWIYDEKNVQYLSVASIVQQIGRVGRLKKGKAFLTTQQLKKLILSDDIVFHLISGIMLSSSEELIKKLNTLGYPFTKNINNYKYQNFLWASISFYYKKNHSPEAVMIGVKGNPKPSSANQICPTYNNLPDPDVKDPNLWALHTEGKLPPLEIDIDNIKNIQLLIIKTKLRAINMNHKSKIYIELKNSLIEKVWDLLSKKSDTISIDKKNKIIKEIKGIVKIRWFNFYDTMNINILRTILDGETQKDYSIIITDSEIDVAMKKSIQNKKNDYIKKYLDKDGFLTMFRCENCDRMMKQLFTIILENSHKLNLCEICVNNLENMDIITYIPNVGYHEKNIN
ncbi:341_t:CDS:2 [Cetraspora pellucida]|uniref:341_t:CDS:1 n=1 Tax=Cetraspora pellucida TaxID=1433469 RepID=A0A9N9NSX8_9GLOM|nr:341_t:CDS:2 [Cetraspora pellucida]